MARISFTTSGATGESTVTAITAPPSARERDTAIEAMFTCASPRIVPTRPIWPGMSR